MNARAAPRCAAGLAAIALGLAAPGAAAPVADAAPAAPAPADPEAFAARVDAAASCTPADVAALAAALPLAPDPDAAANGLFSTARACETGGGDPSVALALYQRILRDYPDDRAAVGAGIRARALAAMIGTDEVGARAARRFAALRSGTHPTDAAALAEADALAQLPWPGAGEVALWRAERLRELAQLAAAAAGYDDVLARFPDTPWARRAAEGAAAVAIARGELAAAERRIAALPDADPADRAVRADLTGQLAWRRTMLRWYRRAWLALAIVIAALAGSLAEASRSARRALAALAPPTEVMYAAPVAAVLIAMAMTAHVAIGPAVAVICLGGLGLGWLSGSGLIATRRAGRRIGPRAAAHVALVLVGVAAIAYIAITRGDLLEMIIETVRFGPEG